MCRLVIAVFHIRHVNVDDAVEQGERLQAIVAAGVVDERQAQSLLRRDVYGGEDLPHHVARRNKIDVVAAKHLQSQHHLGEVLIAHLLAFTLPADLPVLAKDAAQIAPREENRA